MSGSIKKRLDIVVFERGLAESRQKAASMVLAGMVLVDGMPVSKAGAQIGQDAAVSLKEQGPAYVGRGALKLEGAASHFGLSFDGKAVMDVGASTGGFTDYMLRRGARKVYCVDVGHGQLHISLRNDPRVAVLERTNIRHLERQRIPEELDMAVIDVSFISLRLVLPPVAAFIKPGGEVIALVKPQFEAGRKDVGKGGVVKDQAVRDAVLGSVAAFASETGFDVTGSVQSPVEGLKKGNVEYFLYMRKGF